MKSLTFAAFALLATTLVPCASAQWTQDGRPIQDTEWRRTHKEFGAMMLLSDDPDGFLEAWDRPPSPDYKPELKTTEVIPRGKPIVAFIFFQGCKANEHGLCNSTAKFDVLRPDGSQYSSLEPAELWTDKEPPPQPSIQLGQAYVGVVIEPEDPLGEYTIMAKVCDHVADRCLKLVQHFTAVESAPTVQEDETRSSRE